MGLRMCGFPWGQTLPTKEAETFLTPSFLEGSLLDPIAGPKTKVLRGPQGSTRCLQGGVASSIPAQFPRGLALPLH